MIERGKSTSSHTNGVEEKLRGGIVKNQPTGWIRVRGGTQEKISADEWDVGGNQERIDKGNGE